MPPPVPRPLLLRLWLMLAVVVAATALVAASWPTSRVLAGAIGLAAAWVAVRFVRQIQTAAAGHLAELAGIAGAGAIDRASSLAGVFEQSSQLTSQIVLRLSSDAAEQTRNLAQLRSSTAVLQTAFGSMRDGLVVVAADGSVLLVNPAARAMFGLGGTLERGRPLEEVIRSPDTHTLVRAALTGQEQAAEFRIGRVDRVVQARATPLPPVKLDAAPLDAATADSPDATSGVVLALHDVTALRQAERTRTEFVSNVSHELKTPLTTIRAYTDTLQDAAAADDLDAATAERFLARIDEQAERLHEMIVNLLTLARIDSPREAAPLEPVDLAAIVADAVATQQIVARQKGLDLTAELSPLPEVAGDRSGLRSILDNLIRNAIQHTPADGQVTVRLAADTATGTATATDTNAGTTAPANAGMVRLEVTDTGSGIPRDAQSRLFDRFYRVDSARTRDRGGSGLGLAIVHGLVTRFGGRIEVDSTLGQGSTFRVWLPMFSR